MDRAAASTAWLRLATMAAALTAASGLTAADEARRVELIARLQRSVVVVLTEGREISHER